MKANKRRAVGLRQLTIESLEDRRLLDVGLAAAASAAPWQNPVHRFDVDNNGIFNAQDVHLLIDRLMATGSGPLPPPQGAPQYYFDINGDNCLSPIDLLTILNRLNAPPPQVTISTLAPFSVDVTPQVSVSATSSAGVPDNAMVQIDVDLNNDGTFGPDEQNFSQGSLIHGAGTFDLISPLPADNPQTGPYTIRIRARVRDADGIEGVSASEPLVIDTIPSDALKNYVSTPDPSYRYSLANTITDPNGQYTAYMLGMTSQTWRTSADVNLTVWHHWLQVVVPTGAIGTTALLRITGGANTDTVPTSFADPSVVALAVQSHTVTAELFDVPSEPLVFTGDPNNPRDEDAIIAYTFDQYMKNIGQPGNETWPLLLPMVKSAVRAMDTVQNFVPSVANNSPIHDFIVTGYSKRGWTTWLTAAADDRVKAIIPGVFDALNLTSQLVHQYEVYGFFSEAVQDYNDLNIFGRLTTPQGEQLARIVDPYYYLNNGRLTIPKLMIDSAGDPFFASDSAQFYIHDLPGTQNYIRYLPNTNHSLDARAAASTASFYDAILNNRPLPKFSWVVEPDGSIKVQTVDAPSTVLLWQITNPSARDFRKDFLSPSLVWTSSLLTDQGGGQYIGNVPVPVAGATAYLVELTYPSVDSLNPFFFTTEIHVQTNLPLYPWPFKATPNGASTVATSDLGPVTSGLAIQSADSGAAGARSAAAAGSLPWLSSAIGGSTPTPSEVVSVLPVASDAGAAGDEESSGSELDADLVDDAFGSADSDELTHAVA